MPLSRSNRIDRRRRVMLDAVAADSEFAVASARAKRRSRTRENSDSTNDDEFGQKVRDPGYSQAVRRTCQQRMVQLIPVRRGTLTIVLTCMWILWAGLLFSHYWIFTRADLAAAPNTANAASIASLPIAKLFHLRSPHSIAQWLTCQLWMITAVAAWMIFQLRRHKLDDYRARYRIWVVLAISAAFSSFEASSSGLLLLGMSIDGWARREIGYGGWPLVLASFASIIGVIGIRLCSELKSAPMSVVSWLLGLLAWAVSALLGTGLLKTAWSQATIDLVVGGCFLGGILAVFQASGIYLRQTYIHAQKRFLVRNGANLAPIQWKVPKLPFRRNRSLDELSQPSESIAKSNKPKWGMRWSRKHNRGIDELEASDVPRTTSTRGSGPLVDQPTDKPKRRLFGIIPNRHELNEKLEAERIGEDEGPMEDQGLTKKRGWFGIGGNREAEAKSPVSTTQSIAKTIKAESRQNEAEKKFTIPKTDKRSFWSRGSSVKVEPKKEAAAVAPKPKRGWVSKFSNSQKALEASLADSPVAKQTSSPMKQPSLKLVQEAEAVEGKSKKSWLSFASRKLQERSEQKVAAKKTEKASTNESAAKSGRRGLFGMLDGLKLKPPSDEILRQNSQPSSKPVPIKQGQQIPSTQADSDEEDGDDDYSGRPMSKADRKKFRRQQQDDRRAA